MVRKDACYDFSFLKFTDIWFLMEDVIYLEECSMCTWNESIFGCFQMEWFKACVSLLIYCLDYLSIVVSGVLMPSTILLLLSISPFMIAISISSYIELHPYWVNIHLQFLYLLHGLIPLFLLFLINLFFTEGSLLYKILLLSLNPQHESAIGIHISPPFWTSLPFPSASHLSKLIQSSCLSFLSHTENSHWLSILAMVMQASMILFPYISPSPPLSPSP